MNRVRLMIRINNSLHNKIKEKAHDERKSVNQTCIDLFELGLGLTGFKTLIENDHEKVEATEMQLIKRICELYQHVGLLAILKTEGYVADFVLIFENNYALPQVVQQHFTDLHIIVQVMHIPDESIAPSLMWMQIAQTQIIIWATSEFEKEKINKKLLLF